MDATPPATAWARSGSSTALACTRSHLSHCLSMGVIFMLALQDMIVERQILARCNRTLQHKLAAAHAVPIRRQQLILSTGWDHGAKMLQRSIEA